MQDAEHNWFEASDLSQLLLTPATAALESTLGAFIVGQRWFRGKARKLSGLRVLDVLPLPAAGHTQLEPAQSHELILAFVRVDYQDARDAAELYVLPLARTDSAQATPALRQRSLLGLRSAGAEDSVVYDPSATQALSDSLLHLYRQSALPSARGELRVQASEALRTRLSPQAAALHAHSLAGSDQSNTTLFFGQELMLKLFRQLEAGMNPDVEICRFLWDHGYRHAPEPLGFVQYTTAAGQATLSAAQRYVPSQASAWELTNQALQQAFTRTLALAHAAANTPPVLPQGDLLASAAERLPEGIAELLGPLVPRVRRLAERSAELHLVLASDRSDPAFAPQPFTLQYQQALSQAARERLTHVYALLRAQLPKLPAACKALAQRVLMLHGQLDHQLQALPELPIEAARIRCHGDYHLGQVLFTDDDFVIIDFEGEPALPLPERRLPRSALYDVCGMLRSFHYATTVALQDDQHSPETRNQLAPWAEAFYRWCSALFLDAYLTRARNEPGRALFLPAKDDQLRALLRLHMLDKCAYELGYELNNRPDWVRVPLSGLVSLAQANRDATGSPA